MRTLSADGTCGELEVVNIDSNRANLGRIVWDRSARIGFGVGLNPAQLIMGPELCQHIDTDKDACLYNLFD